MKRLWYVLLLLLAIGGAAFLFLVSRPAPAPAADAQTLRVANGLLESGQAADATLMYEQLVSQGIRSADVYYNLGNAYFSQGNLGQAILNYRRAQALAPRDEDVRANLSLARAQANQTLDASPATPMFRVTRLLESWLTLSETAAGALGLLAAFALLFIIARRLEPGFPRRLSRLALILVAVLMVAGVAAFGSRMIVQAAQPAGVVIVGDAPLKVSPDADSAPASLPGGTEVRVVAEQDDWVQVVFSSGQRQGWLPKTSVAVVS